MPLPLITLQERQPLRAMSRGQASLQPPRCGPSGATCCMPALLTTISSTSSVVGASLGYLPGQAGYCARLVWRS
jgi:hypothetical protein